MFLKDTKNGDLVEVLDIKGLIDPNQSMVVGRYHAGEEMQDPAKFAKANLIFPSEETLPRCWVDVNYKQ
jgi:hypothetical protein